MILTVLLIDTDIWETKRIYCLLTYSILRVFRLQTGVLKLDLHILSHLHASEGIIFKCQHLHY